MLLRISLFSYIIICIEFFRFVNSQVNIFYQHILYIYLFLLQEFGMHSQIHPNKVEITLKVPLQLISISDVNRFN